MEYNAMLRSLYFVCIFCHPTYISLWETIWFISLYPITELMQVIMNWCYSVWLHDPAPFINPTPFPSLDKDPWLLVIVKGFLLKMETIKCLWSTIGWSFQIRCLLIPKEKKCFSHNRSCHWTTAEVGFYTACRWWLPNFLLENPSLISP